ncbi:MAG: DUF4445 domain-containing protein [bacterium]|nr:DUF4445 domain-containing protein [bacterium]
MSEPESETSGFRVRFTPADREGHCKTDENLLDCARRHRVRIASSCGGQGRCAACVVQFVDGPVPEPSPADQQAFSARRLAEGWRRACLVDPIGDCTVWLPPRSTAAPMRTLVDGRETHVEPESVIERVTIELPPASLDDVRADDQRLLDALAIARPGGCEQIDLDAIREFPDEFRKNGGRLDAFVRRGELIATGPVGRPALGLAIDLGTTNISACLSDLESGETLASAGIENPQTRHGGDLISYAALVRSDKKGAQELQGLAVEALGELLARLCSLGAASSEQIVDAVVVGNTMMHHLLLGLPVEPLATAPFIPALSDAIDVRARDLGLVLAAGTRVHLLPNIAAFVGGDHVATLLATLPGLEARLCLAMDIGTNTEISLIEGDSITSLSCPSGPAFEGAHIACGMRAAVGAVERIRLLGDEVRVDTIEDAPPVGICGSGVLDAVAQLFLTGVMNERGRIQEGHPRVRNRGHRREFVLVRESDSGPEIVFTQEDVRAVQLAKAAIRAATDLLLKDTGHVERELEQVVVAGAFGNYIDLSSAQAIGMLPPLPFQRFAQVGNAAGDGARLALLSRQQRDAAAAIARRCRYLELAGNPAFQTSYIEHIGFSRPV